MVKYLFAEKKINRNELNTNKNNNTPGYVFFIFTHFTCILNGFYTVNSIFFFFERRRKHNHFALVNVIIIINTAI